MNARRIENLIEAVLVGALLCALAVPAFANTCVCSAATCTTSGAANWSGCNATPPGNTDDVVIQSGKTVTIDNSPSWNTGEVQSGGTLKCTDDTTARTVTIDNTKTDAIQATLADWMKVDSGGTLDCDGATGVEGNDITFSYTGTIPGATGASFLVGHALASNISLTTDAVFKLRGLKRAATAVTNVGLSATTTDFIFCSDMVAGLSSAAVGDYIVFKTGRMSGYWGRVTARPDSCTGAGNPDALCTGADATAECTAVACGGGPCDIQFDMNDANRAILSMTKVAGDGGPVRQATPDDGNADGTADPTITFPQAGDSVEVFKPAVITGGANAITNGARFLLAGAQANMRYVEFKGLNSSRSADSCTSGGAVDGTTSMHLELISSTAPEGDIAMINVHDYASSSAIEWNATDRTDDSRANYPIIYRDWYVHEVDTNVAGTCTDTNKQIGGGIAITTDSGSTYNIQGLIAERIHVARINSVSAIQANGPQSATTFQWSGIRIINPIVHDLPYSAAYSYCNAAGGTATSFRHGTDVQVLGPSIWDVGNNTTPGGCASNLKVQPMMIAPDAVNFTGGAKTGIRVQNPFIVNYDVNSDAESAQAAIDMTGGLTGASAVTDTANVRVSNGYIANGVGSGTKGGAVYYTMFKDPNIDDDGSAPCSANRRGTMYFPEDAYGNVVVQTSSASCPTYGIFMNPSTYGQPGAFATRTRKWISNLLLVTNANAGLATAGIGIRTAGSALVIGTDIYNNLIDTGSAASAAGYDIHYDVDAGTAVYTERYNILARAITNAVRNPGSGTFDTAYNRAYVSGGNMYSADPDGGGPCTAAAGCTADVDSDTNDIFSDISGQFYGPICNASIRDDSVGGWPIGPLSYGIKDFQYFHPAAIASMNALAFKLRYNWLTCSGANQDAIPR